MGHVHTFVVPTVALYDDWSLCLLLHAKIIEVLLTTVQEKTDAEVLH